MTSQNLLVQKRDVPLRIYAFVEAQWFIVGMPENEFSIKVLEAYNNDFFGEKTTIFDIL